MVCFQASCHNGLDPAGDIGNNLGCDPWPVPTCVTRELGNEFGQSSVENCGGSNGGIHCWTNTDSQRKQKAKVCRCQPWKAMSVCSAMVPPTRMWAGHQQHP